MVEDLVCCVCLRLLMMILWNCVVLKLVISRLKLNVCLSFFVEV